MNESQEGSPDRGRRLVETLKGGGFLAGGQMTELITRLGIAFFLARTLQPEGYGLYNLAISAGALFAGIGAFGFDDAMVRYLAVMRSKKDRPGLIGTLQVGMTFSLVGGSLIGVVLYVAAPAISSTLFENSNLGPLLRIIALVLPVLVTSNMLAASARGLKRMDISALSENVVMSLTRLCIVAALSFVGFSPRTAVIVFAISDLFAVMTLVVMLNREIPLREWVQRSARRDVGEITRFALPMWFSGTLNKFRKNLETIFVGALASVASAGVYTVVTRINMIGHVVYRSIIVTVKPQLAELAYAGERREIDHLYKTTTRWLLIANIPPFLFIVLYPTELLAIFGKGFTNGAMALALLATGELINAGTGICGSIIDMTRHHVAKLINSVLWLGLVIGGQFLLVPRYGLLGAALASVIATVSINLIRMMQVWALERVQPYELALVKPALAGAAAYLSGRFALQVSSGRLALIQGLGVVVVYLGALLALGIEPEDRVIVGKVWRRARRLVPLWGTR